MATGYEVTGQHYTTERGDDGMVHQVVEVGFTTTGAPPVKGHVTVDKALLRDPVDYATAVKSAIESAVAGHDAVEHLS